MVCTSISWDSFHCRSQDTFALSPKSFHQGSLLPLPGACTSFTVGEVSLTLALPRDTGCPLGKNSARKIIDANVTRGTLRGKNQNQERITLQEMECCFCNFPLEFWSALAGEWGQTNEFIYSLGWLPEWKGRRAKADLGSKPQLVILSRSWHFQDFLFYTHRILIGLPVPFFFFFFFRQNNSLKSESSFLDLPTLSRHFCQVPRF